MLHAITNIYHFKDPLSYCIPSLWYLIKRYNPPYNKTLWPLCFLFFFDIWILITPLVFKLFLILQYWQSYHIFCIYKIKRTYKTKDRVIWTPLKTGGELRWFRTGISSCSTSCTRRVNLVTIPVCNVGKCYVITSNSNYLIKIKNLHENIYKL
jgi:hypothetical protein